MAERRCNGGGGFASAHPNRTGGCNLCRRVGVLLRTLLRGASDSVSVEQTVVRVCHASDVVSVCDVFVCLRACVRGVWRVVCGVCRMQERGCRVSLSAGCARESQKTV